jgi:guanylate kinase
MRDAIQLLILCSPSGAGKTTLAHRLLEDPRLPGLHFSISHTTRHPRQGEEHGRDYYFVDEPGFRKILDSGGFAEHATVHGHLYGTSVEEIERIGSLEGARGIVFDIDVQGARQLVQRYPEASTVMILPPSLAELKARLARRGTEKPEELSLRLRNAVGELEHYKEFKFIVVNDVLNHAYDALRDIVVGTGGTSHYQQETAEALLRQWKEEDQA